MPAPRKVSCRQTEVLLSYMEANKDLAKGRVSQEGGPLGKQTINDSWERLAEKLNCVGNGATKSHKEWRVYWNNLKYKTRAKAADRKNHMSGTGGGPAWEKGNLTEDEWRVMSILGKECIYGEESVRIPFPVSDEIETPAVVEEALPPGPSTSGISHVEDNCQVAPPLVTPLASALSFSSTLHASPDSSPDFSMPARQAQAPLPPRPYVRRPVTIPDVPEWARQNEERNIAAQERTAQALESILEIQTQILKTLNERLPLFQVE